MDNRILNIREENDLTQEQLGKILNVSRVLISKWETGKEIPPIRRINILSNHFKVSLDYIFKFSDNNNYENIINKDFNLKMIGERIKLIRKDNNLTLRSLADELKTSSSTISAYETGKTLILTAFAIQICRKYKVSIDWLYAKTK